MFQSCTLLRPLTVCLLIGSILGLQSCQAPPDEDLTAANAAMAKMASASTLRRSCFTIVYPEGQASDFLSYLFSDLGTAEWPIAFDEMEAQQMKSIGQVPLPPNVVVSPNSRSTPDSKEIVLIADDDNREIRVEGYLADSEDVALEANWPLGTAQAGEDARMLCESNLQIGISGGE